MYCQTAIKQNNMREINVYIGSHGPNKSKWVSKIILHYTKLTHIALQSIVSNIGNFLLSSLKLNAAATSADVQNP